MASLLAKRIYCFSPSLHRYQYQRHHYPSLFPALLRLSLSTQSRQSKEEEIPFIAQYLVSSLGFSLDRALKVSTNKKLSLLKTRDRPDSVVSFLKEIGLSHSQVRSLLLFIPALLNLSVEKILKPQLRELMDAGFTGEMLIQLIRSNPQCLYLKDTLSRLRFWRNFVGNSEGALFKVIRNNNLLIGVNMDKFVMPRIKLLKEYGLSYQEIVKLITTSRGFLLKRLDFITWALKQTEELGILRDSNMFLYGLQSVGCLNKETLEKKMAGFIEMYGWSKEDISSAFRKCPSVFALSEDNIKSKMDFLIKEAGFEPRSIASQARLLACSKERILVPRHNVLSALEAKGLNTNCGFFYACILPEKKFFERFVVPYEKGSPEIHEAYIATRGGKVPV